MATKEQLDQIYQEMLAKLEAKKKQNPKKEKNETKSKKVQRIP